MGFKNIFNLKTAMFGLSATAVVGGVTATVVQTAVTKARNGNPFVLIFTNGENKSVNSDYRLLGRHQDGYINRDKSDKFGKYSSWEVELGLQLDNSNPAVQAEQLNWLYYLLFFNKTRTGEDFQAANKNIANYGAANAANSLFDGIRIDCGDGVDSDVIGQTSQLLNDLYDRKSSDAAANDHLSYNEGYGPSDVPNEEKYFHNSSLNYDDSYYQNMTSHLMWYSDNNIPNLQDATSWIDGYKWPNDQNEDEINPNLTYSQNHDNFNGRIEDICRLEDPNFTYKNFDPDKQGELMKRAARKYYRNLSKVDKTWKGKQISPKNQVALYADMLTNKDTVPIVFYGDLFEAQDEYMKTPTAIAQPIVDILSARSKYVSGGQQRIVNDSKNGQVMTNVRFGKGHFEDAQHNAIDPVTQTKYVEGTNEKQTVDPDSGRNSGIVTIYSNDPNVNIKKLKIHVGKNHHGQEYETLINTSYSDSKDDMGLTISSLADANDTIMGTSIPDSKKLKVVDPEVVGTVDENGDLIIPSIKGVNKPFVSGYLSVLVPKTDSQSDQNVYVSEADAEKMHTEKRTHHVLNSNAALDSHVLYQDFATMDPDQGLNKNQQSADTYAMLADRADAIANSGITDVWMAPPYISPDQSKKGTLLDWVKRYGYGYMMSDRYNLGDGDTPSKYGTSDQLVEAINKLHEADSKIKGRKLKTMLDFIPHQIIRGDSEQKELVTFDEYNANVFGAPLTLGKAHVSEYLQTKTSTSNYQYKFGGKYLNTIDKLFPDIFEKEAESTGDKLPVDEPIKQWSAKYEVSYPLEFGLGQYETAGKDTGGNYDGYYLYRKQ